MGGSDAFVTSKALAAAIRKIGDYSLVITGEESEDGSTGQVPPGIAEWLGIPIVTYVSQVVDVTEDSIIVKRTIKGGYEIVKVRMPAVISVELGVNTRDSQTLRDYSGPRASLRLRYGASRTLGLPRMRWASRVH